MSVKWIKDELPIRFAKFDTPGDAVRGRVVAYTPLYGAENYDRTETVGAVVLHDSGATEPVLVKVALDKGQLATQVENAMIRAYMDEAVGRVWLAIKFEAWSDAEARRGHKVFKAVSGIEVDDG